MLNFFGADALAGVLGFTIAFLASMALTPLVIRAASRYEVFDSPSEARRMHVRPVPRLGGIAVFTGALVAVVLLDRDSLLFGHGHHLASVLLGTSMMFVIGLVDDLAGLRPLTKLLGQLSAAIVFVVTAGFPSSVGVLPGTAIFIGWAGAPLMVLWIVAVTNAYNLIDGLNGLATGIAIVAALGASLSAVALGSGSPGVPLLALIGALAGFSRFNFPRGRIFLGDSGTMSVGFLLSVLLIRSATTPSGSVLVLVPTFAVMVPFLDTGLAIVRRWLRNEALSGADARHIHHRLLAMGLSQSQTVVLLWILAVSFAGFGLLVTFAPPALGGILSAIGSALFAVVVIYGTNILAYHELSIARDVLVQGPRRIRRVISDQIHAVDLCQQIRSASSLTEVNSLLERYAPTFGFSRMNLRADARRQVRVRQDEREKGSGTGWRLDFHVTSELGAYDATLSIWSWSHDGRVSGAERVARTLAPTLTAWIESGVDVEETKPTRTRLARGATPHNAFTAVKPDPMILPEPSLQTVPDAAGAIDVGLRRSK